MNRESPAAWVRRVSSSLLDLLFPPQCASCGRLLAERAAFCLPCRSRVVPADSPLCPVCGRVFPSRRGPDHPCGRCLRGRRPFRRARSYALFEGPVAEAIHRFKYRGEMGLAGPLASLLHRGLPGMGFAGGWHVIVPVPLHPRRLRERGFNQSALLALELGRALDLPADLRSLRKSEPGRPQVGLSERDRERNIKGTFCVPDGRAFGRKNVLLVDDVYTTGATVSECARVLRRSGAKCVDVLTLARTP